MRNKKSKKGGGSEIFRGGCETKIQKKGGPETKIENSKKSSVRVFFKKSPAPYNKNIYHVYVSIHDSVPFASNNHFHPPRQRFDLNDDVRPWVFLQQ